ncbi:MAG: nuclear transport factor 2 family protein [Chitinophagales bacterium]
MKKFVLIPICFFFLFTNAQSSEQKLIQTVESFHKVLVSGNADSIRLLTSAELTYGHSNGWVETRDEVIENLQSGYINYNSYMEDSMQVVITGKQAHVRFVADIGATFKGKDSVFHLKVLEVWVREGKLWKLYARQAVKG